MNPEQIIESYVSEVVRRLPRGQRGDVAVELRSLLREELAGRSADGGVEPDEAGAIALLTDFGRPAEVAARYRPTFTIVDPADSRAFLRASVVGVALVWFIGLVDAFRDGPATVGDGLLVLRDFFFAVGLPALMWPGFLVVWFGLAGWARRRFPGTTGWKPRPVERDAVNRFGLTSAVVFFAAGTAVLVNPAEVLDLVSGRRLSDAGYAAFAYDSGFLRMRGPAVLAVIVAGLVLLTAVLIRGRWEPGTRRAQLALNVVNAGVLLWVLVGGPTFREPATDGMVRLAVALTIVAVLFDLVRRTVRWQRRRLSAVAASRIA